MRTELTMKNEPIMEVVDAVKMLHQFIDFPQMEVIGDACRGEEGEHFKNKLIELARIVSTMPKTYEQDGKGDDAIVYLHYFKGAGDWYITEKDVDTDGAGQIQAFGLADLGYGGELGYISIAELLENRVELDLYWTPKTIKEIRGNHR